eukprot:771146-Rhodomonas_salina.4
MHTHMRAHTLTRSNAHTAAPPPLSCDHLSCYALARPCPVLTERMLLPGAEHGAYHRYHGEQPSACR